MARLYPGENASFPAKYLDPRVEIGEEVGVWVQKEPMGCVSRALKRTIDLVISACLIGFLAPTLMAIALAIKLDSPGPILFRQSRNGYHGRVFEILEFRTMTAMQNGSAIMQATRNDARVTRVGRWLRMTGVDQLPQLFNVLAGEMSLIGPRPHAVAHNIYYAKLIEDYQIRHHVKPGITGWAQVNDLRGEPQTIDLMRRRIALDLWYARNCSLLLDLRILALTVLEVSRSRNSYRLPCLRSRLRPDARASNVTSDEET